MRLRPVQIAQHVINAGLEDLHSLAEAGLKLPHHIGGLGIGAFLIALHEHRFHRFTYLRLAALGHRRPCSSMMDRIGLNASCAFRKSYEFHPVIGANVTIVSGNSQAVAPNQPVPSPLKVLVMDNTGKPLVGALTEFCGGTGLSQCDGSGPGSH